MLKLRLITAAVLLSVFFAVLFLLPWSGFILFVSIVVVIGAWEWANLSGFQSFVQKMVYTLFTVIVIIGVAFYTGLFNAITASIPILETAVRNVLIVAGIWWAIALLWVQGFPSSAILWGSRWVRAIMGWLVLVPMWLAVIYLDQLAQGPMMIILLLATVVIADTGAYFFGRAFGKRKLAVAVSPGKSWEGFWGGLLCCGLLAVAVTAYKDFSHWITVLIILLVTALSSVLGDLLESMVKRYRDVKDSGRILPGHGGILDRIDSITAAAPIFVLALLLSGWSL